MTRLFLVVAAATLVTACGSGAVERGRSGGGKIDHPGGGGDIVLQAVRSGGSTPLQMRLGGVPEVSVYGNGRVITVGPTTAQYPGPALPNVQEFRLTERGLQRILAAARGAGLLDARPPDYGTPTVTDVPTTVIELHAGGRRRAVRVYALGFDSPGLNAEQRAARDRLQRALNLAGDAGALAAWVFPGSQRPYEPQSLAVFVSPYSEAGPGAATPTGLQWPLGDLRGAGQPGPFGNSVRCLLVTGAELGQVLDAARNANETTRWESNGNAYSLVFRPLLPDQHSCADLRPALRSGA